MWGASKELTAIMQRSEKISDVLWNTVELLISGAQFEVWSREDGTFLPVINAGMCIDDLAPEKSVTKQLWINRFKGIEKWRKESKY